MSCWTCGKSWLDGCDCESDTDEGCDYCYGAMGLCPVCGPFEYAPSEAVGYDPKNGKHRAYHIDGWDLSGRMPDWHDRANEQGWCWRDTDAFFRKMYDGHEFEKLLLSRSGLAIARDEPKPQLVVTSFDWDTETAKVCGAPQEPFRWAPQGNRHERRKAAAIARRKHA